MSDVNNIQGLTGANQIRRISGQGYENAIKAQTPAGEGDTVEISTIAQMLAKIRELPDVRHEKVNEVRQAIMSGTYDLSEKLDTAVEGLLEDLGEL